MASLKTISKLSARRQGRPAPELIFGDLWTYDPAPETADPKLKARYELFINGRFTAPKSGRYFNSINPANERKLAEIAVAGPADVEAAYRAAVAAANGAWSRLAAGPTEEAAEAFSGSVRAAMAALDTKVRTRARLR